MTHKKASLFMEFLQELAYKSNRLLHYVGLLGILGISLLTATFVGQQTYLLPAEKSLLAQEARLAVAVDVFDSAAPDPPSGNDRPTSYTDILPDASKPAGVMGELQKHASEIGFRITGMEFQEESGDSDQGATEPWLGVTLTGEAGDAVLAIKFINKTLTEMPNSALDFIVLHRTNPASTKIDLELGWRFFYRK